YTALFRSVLCCWYHSTSSMCRCPLSRASLRNNSREKCYARMLPRLAHKALMMYNGSNSKAEARRNDDRHPGNHHPGGVPDHQGTARGREPLEPRGVRNREQAPGGADPHRTPQVTTVDRGPGESPGLSLVLCGLSTLIVPCGLLGAERGAPPARKRHQPTARETQQNRGPTESHRQVRPGDRELRFGLSGRSGARLVAGRLAQAQLLSQLEQHRLLGRVDRQVVRGLHTHVGQDVLVHVRLVRRQPLGDVPVTLAGVEVVG